MESGPIFVAGLERSGTSLIFALLASHPHIAMTRRTNLWTHFYGQYGDLADPRNFERCLETMLRYKRLVILRPDADRLRRDFWSGEPTYARLFALLEGQHAARLGKPRWGDKSLNTERYAEPILAAYPGARILHMIRDPRDRYASSLTRWATRRGGVGAGAAEWLASARLAARNRRRHPDRYAIVRYESLVGSAEATLRAICAFIDEPYVPRMMSMDGAAAFRDRGSNSSYGERQPAVISTASVGRFRDVLTPRQIAFLQLAAADEMAAFGYEPEPLSLAAPQRLGFVLRDVPQETVRLAAWRTREFVHNRVGRPVPAHRLVGSGQGTAAPASGGDR